jgi:hypothetical protein
VSSKLRSPLGALFGVLLLLLLAGVSLFEAIRVLIVCTVQVSTGAFFVSNLWFRRRLNLEEVIGLGFAVGATFSVVSDQVFLTTAIKQIGWLTPSFIAIVYYSVTKNRVTADHFNQPVEKSNNLVWLGIGVLAILGPEWYWPAIPAVLFAVAQLLTISQAMQRFSRRFKHVLISVLRVLGVMMLGLGVYIRPSSWWIEDSDFGFFEALAVSFSNWGINENSLAVGSSIKYHWFVYAWMGGVTKAAQLPSWVMLSRAGIVIGVVAVVCLAWIAISNFCRSYISRVVALLIFCFFDSYPSWGSGFRIGLISSPSQLIGFAWLLAIFVLIIEQQKQKVKFSSLLFLVLFTGAMLSKISHGVVGLSGLVFLATVELVSSKKITLQRLSDVVVSLTTVVTLFFLFYFGANNATISPLKFPAAIQGELSNYVGVFIFSASVVLMLGFVNYQLTAVVGGLLSKGTRGDSVFLFCIGTGVSGVVLSLVIDVYMGAQLYFLHSAAIILLIFAASFTTNGIFSFVQDYLSAQRSLVISFIGFFSALVAWQIPSLDSGSKLAMLLRLSRSAVLIIPLLFVLFLALSKKKSRELSAVMLIISLGFASLGVGFYASNWWVTINKEFASFDRNEKANLGTAELNSAMKWLRDSSDHNDVFASNNDSFLLSALSHRRGFLQSKYLLRRHTEFTTNWESELDERGDLLTRVFLSSNSDELKELYSRGVRWLIVDKSKIASVDLVSFGESSFENDGYVILDLDLLS